MRRCSKCFLEKPVEDFSKNGHRSDGLQPWCKSCYESYRAGRKDYRAKQQSQYREENHGQVLEEKRVYRAQNKDAINHRTKVLRRQKPWLYVCYESKKRSKKAGLPFNISPDYIRSIWPKDNCCPIFGTEFSVTYSQLSASLDRLIPYLGYTIGNVSIISVRANAIKQNEQDPSSIRAVADWFEKQLGASSWQKIG